MRVLYFSREYTSHDYRFLTSLAESGHEPFFLRLEQGGYKYEDRSLPPAVTQVRWAGGQKPFQWRDLPGLLGALREVLREVRPDILHAGPIQTAAFLSALSGFQPLVSMSWGSDLLRDADRSLLYRWITRYTLRRTPVLIVDNDAVRRKAAAFGFPEERICQFPWGIDLDQFAPRTDAAAMPGSPASGQPAAFEPLTGTTLRQRLNWRDCFVVLSLRAWEPVYGIDVLLRGFARAAAQRADLRLLMPGGGSLAPMVHRIIREHGLETRVHLAGQINQADLPGVYRAADLYVSASHSDGSSVSLMEALGSGLPVVVTDIPSNREWIAPGREGWLFPDNDAAALGDLIVRAAEQPEMLADKRAAARARAEERADWKKNFQVLLQGYRKAIELTKQKPA